jgi:ADP-ribosyltransferase exoenzyme
LKISKKRLERFIWQEKDLNYLGYADSHFVTHASDIEFIKDVAPISIKSDFKTTDLKHLKSWHKKVLNNPNHINIISEAKHRRSTIPKDHRDTVYSYMQDSYPINSSLRSNNRLAQHKTSIDHLDKVTNNPLKHNTVVYRGLNNEEGKSFLKNKIFEDKGFHGASLDPDVADGISSLSNYSARIFLKKGDKGAYLPHARNEFPNFDAEHEFLLPRGQRYKVLGHHYDENEDKKYIDIEVHPKIRKPIKKKVKSSLDKKIEMLKD